MGAERSGRAISRRSLFKYGAATGAVATVAGMTPAASAHDHGVPPVLPAPKPIPGGNQIGHRLAGISVLQRNHRR